MSRRIELPAVVRQKAAHLGAAGTRWLDALPETIGELSRRWSVTVGPTYPGGSEAYVARVRTVDGSPAVLKIALPSHDVAGHAAILRAARGHGYVRLLEADPRLGALLLEALGPSMGEEGLAAEVALPILARALQDAWQLPPSTVDGSGPEKGRSLRDYVVQAWQRLGQPCSEAVLAQAVEYADRRSAAYDPGRCVVVHGDPHPGNALRAGSTGQYRLVDPACFLAEPAYDLGVAVRDWSPSLIAARDPRQLAAEHCRLLATATGVPEQSIWEWGFLERVSTGLYCLEVGADALGRPYLQSAELLV